MSRVSSMSRLMALAAFASAVLAFPAAAPAASVPAGFLGIHMEDPADLDSAGVSIAQEFATAKANGVETFRFPVYWSSIQPYATWAAVPESRRGTDCTEDPSGGAPWCLRVLSSVVDSAALNGIKLVPILLNAPRWAADLANYPTGPTTGLTMQIPKDFDQLASFAKGLAQRYGPGGSMLPAGKESPIAAWQIWNEPNFRQYWPQHDTECAPTRRPTSAPTPCPTISFKDYANRTITVNLGSLSPADRDRINNPAPSKAPLWSRVDAALAAKSVTRLYFAPSYLDLVKRTRSALRTVDPNAKVMLASIANGDFSVRPQRAARAVDLDFIYRAGGKGSFDVVAANIFTGNVNQLSTRITDYRAAMKTGGDNSLPLAVSEFSWADRMGLPTSAFRPGQLSLAVGAGQAPCTQAKSNCPPTSQAAAVTAAIDALVRKRTEYKLWGAYWHSWATDYSTQLDGNGLVDL
ncbi:MAG: hypothetical protein WCO96_03530, partial [Actinomycetes bacterium]